MQQRRLTKLLIILISFCFVNNVSAQADKIIYHSHSISKGLLPPPSAVLVQLRSGHNKLVYFSQHHDISHYNEVIKEIGDANKAMINDFKDHFSYCPVYYFIDTNTHFVKNMEFDGILLNADGAVVNDIKIPSGDTSYLVVFHGYPEDNPYSFPVRASNNDPDYAYGSGYPFGKGLNVLNYEFIQVDYFYRLQGQDLFHKPQPKYEYRAKRFDIDYYPMAKSFNDNLHKFLPKLRKLN